MNFIEELLASLGEDADKAKIEAGLKSYVESQVAEQMPELKKHSDTLLGEKKALKKELDELKASYAWLEENELDSAKFKEFKDEYEQLKASSASGAADIEAIKKEVFESGKKTKANELLPIIEKAKEDITAYQTKAKNYQDQFIQFQTEIKLNELFNKLHIDDNPFTRQGIKSFAKTEYNELDNQLTISMFDPSQNKHIPLSDWETSFPNTDAGKAIIKVPVNTGGGANGGSGGTGKDGKIENAFEGMFKTTS